jgi:hypothetical protein
VSARATRERARRFCRALDQEIGDDPQRWTTITAVADRMGIDQDKAEALAAELDEQGLVPVGGGHSVTLAPEGWQSVRSAADRRPSRRSGKAHAKARAGRSA